jgi:hypothetical protein
VLLPSSRQQKSSCPLVGRPSYPLDRDF